MIARIAAGLARSQQPEHRWRRVATPSAATITLLLVLATASIVAMVRREEDRDMERTALNAEVPAPTDLLLFRSDDRWDGVQFQVMWMEPVSEAAPVLPAGMPRLPAPGQAVVSPALDRLAAREPDVAARYPDRLVLDRNGVRSGGELLAYVRMPADRTLADNPMAARVNGFGAPLRGNLFFAIGFPARIEILPISQGLIAFLIVPGLVVLAIGVATASGVRDHRFAVLRRLGASPRTLSILAAIETLLLVVPGFAVAAIVWGLVAPRLGSVPFVGHDVVHGDLGLPWWLIVAMFGTAAGLTALGAALSTFTRERRGVEATPRPVVGKAALTPMRMAPLGFAIASWVAWRIVGGDLGVTIFLAGVVVALTAVPLLLPGLLRPAGAVIRRLGSVPALLAGRGLEWDPVRMARPVAGVGALVALALSATGYFALLWEIDDAPPTVSETPAVLVGWIDPHDDDTGRLAAELGSGLVVPIRQDRDALLIGATCADLAHYISDLACDPMLPLVASRDALRGITGLAFRPGADVRLVPSDQIDAPVQAVVLDRLPVEALESDVQAAAMQILPAPAVRSAQALALRPSPLVDWLAAGIGVALAVLAVACIVAIVDRLLATRSHRHLLLSIGVLPRHLAALEAWRFAAPYAVVLTAGTVVGLAISAQIVATSSAAAPWGPIAWIVGLAAIVGVVGTAVVAAFGWRGTRDH